MQFNNEEEKRKEDEETMDQLKEFMNKKTFFLIGKIIMAMITAGMAVMFFATENMYKVTSPEEKYLIGRIIAVIILAALEIAIIFVKNILSERINNILSVVLWITAILGLFALLEYSQGFEIFRLSFFDFKYNLFIIFTLLAFFYVITNSFRFSIILSSIAICLLGLSNYYLIQFRGTGLLASDIYNVGTAMNVADNYDYSLNYNCYILVLVTVIICTISVKLKKYVPFRKIKRLIPAICGAAVIGVFFGKVIINDQFDKEWKIKMFRPQVSYERHGSILMFAHSFRYNIIEKPEEYSVDQVKEIAKNYNGTVGKSDKKPNVIVIMDEAFSDLTQIGDFKLSEDCMPFYHSLKENAIKGKLFVSVCAGGTASTEFEALTSNTMAFTPLKSSPYQIYINDPMPSLATTLKAQDYSGILAMHPYLGNGYKRDKVYPLLGFNQFITLEDFNNPKLIRNFVSDEEDFNRIIKEYEASKKNSDNPFFMFNVTMQNHSAYDREWDNLNMDITLSGKIVNTKSSIYVNLIKETDNALKGLIEYFKNVDEPTVIAFFGDHQPRIGSNFYKQVLKTSPLDKKYNALRNYFTAFTIWANYDIEEKDDVWISANYLSSMILDVAGVSKTGYQQYVSEIREEVPVITQLGYIGKDGNFYNNDDRKSPYYDKLKEYQIVEYNNLFDSKNRIDGFFDINE
ncbi:MAG: LTA synthase family protein [Eubacterium sp.]